jgi:dGTPase
VRRLIDLMVTDLITQTRRRLEAARPASADDVRRLKAPVAAFSEEMKGSLGLLRDFLFQSMYRHYKVNRMASKARRVVRDLFRLYVGEPQCLPTEWRRQADGLDEGELARLVADYIAGMTDRFALNEHQRLFDPYARSE